MDCDPTYSGRVHPAKHPNLEVYMAFDVKTATDDELRKKYRDDEALLPTLVGWLYPPIVRQELVEIRMEMERRGIGF